MPQKMEDLLFKGIKGFFRTLSILPFKALYPMSKALAYRLSKVPWSRKRVAVENLRASFPELDQGFVEDLYRKVVAHFLAVALEMAHLEFSTPERLRAYYTVEGKDLVLKAFEGKRGLLLLTGHMGNWELLNLAFALEFTISLPFKAFVVARRLDNPVAERWIRDIRTRFGTGVIDKQNAMRQIFRSLRANCAVGILLDQNVDWYQGVFVRFLGRWACTNKGMAQIALKTGAPVIPAFAIRTNSGYKVGFHEPLNLVDTGRFEWDTEENTQLFTSVLEQKIRSHPEQWLWFHRRWKTRQAWPIGEGKGAE